MLVIGSGAWVCEGREGHDGGGCGVFSVLGEGGEGRGEVSPVAVSLFGCAAVIKELAYG
jgi:hypothetical protein